MLHGAPHLPVDPAPFVDDGRDKALHLFEYALLAGLLVRALARTRPAASRAWLLAAAVALCIGHGAVDEWFQRDDPRRNAEWGDLAADAAGALCGAGAWVTASRRRAAVDGERRRPPAA